MPESTNDSKKDADQESDSPPALEDMETGETELESESKDGELAMDTSETKSPG